jgi:hypothetical protein
MPVWVKGNMQSETFVIFLQGGPGASSYVTNFENTAHAPCCEEPELFVEKVRAFIDKYK